MILRGDFPSAHFCSHTDGNGSSPPTPEGVTSLRRIFVFKIIGAINPKGSNKLKTVDIDLDARERFFLLLVQKIEMCRLSDSSTIQDFYELFHHRFSPRSQGSKASMTDVLFEVILCIRSWSSVFKIDWVLFIILMMMNFMF